MCQVWPTLVVFENNAHNFQSHNPPFGVSSERVASLWRVQDRSSEGALITDYIPQTAPPGQHGWSSALLAGTNEHKGQRAPPRWYSNVSKIWSETLTGQLKIGF